MDIFSSGKFCSIIFGVTFHLLFTLFSLSLVVLVLLDRLFIFLIFSLAISISLHISSILKIARILPFSTSSEFIILAISYF